MGVLLAIGVWVGDLVTVAVIVGVGIGRRVNELVQWAMALERVDSSMGLARSQLVASLVFVPSWIALCFIRIQQAAKEILCGLLY